MREILCGRFVIRLEGDSAIPENILKGWERNSGEQADPDIVLRLERGHENREQSSGKEWQASTADGITEAGYYRNGKELFSLKYGNPMKDIRINTPRGDGINTRIGIQYGMMLGLYRQCIGLHGVTLVCGNEVIILSAPSGTGKTTLAGLLEKYCDGITVNGDFALLSPTEDGVIYEPTPFCGSSGRSLNHRMKVNRVVFLSQAKKNQWRELPGREAVTKIMNNAFIPEWNAELRQTVQENAMKCLSGMKINGYAFAPTKEAAETFVSNLDGNIG